MRRIGSVPCLSRLFCLVVFASISIFPIFAIDYSMQITPLVAIPFQTGPDGADFEAYKIGGGLGLVADFSFFDIFAPYLETGIRLSPVNDTVSQVSLNLVNGGGGLSLAVNPIPRLSARIGGGGGLYAGMLGDKSNLSLYWSTRADFGYRFTPTFSILASTGYASFLTDSTPMYSGFSAGISFRLGLALLSGRNTGMTIDETQEIDVFPLRYQAYEKERFGTIQLTNRESGEIRDVRVYVAAGGYGSREAFCGTIPVLRRGASVGFPLYAAFNEGVLAFTENTKVQAEIIVRYKLLDSSMDAKQSVALRFNHRNAMVWADPRLAAAFTSPNDPAILDLSKYLAGLVRDRIRPEIDKNLQYGMGVFEGLRLSGIVWAADPSTPYKDYRGVPDRLDYIQYPYQTLAYKSGDSDDIALLCAEAFESVGISSALIPLKDEMLVAFPLASEEEALRASFGSAAELVYLDGKAWLPLQVSLIREGFLRAWQGGSKKWKDAEASGQSPELIVLAEAWKTYPAVGLPAVDFRPSKPLEEYVALAFDNVLTRFVAREIEPKVKKLLADIGRNPTPKQLNSLGILYARYGMLDEAKVYFQKASGLGFAPAFTNLANVSFLQKDYETAARWFEEALKGAPTSKSAIIGLARARYELDAYAEADDLFAKVKAMDAALAARYSYLSSKVDGSTSRASSAAADRGGAMSWSEED